MPSVSLTLLLFPLSLSVAQVNTPYLNPRGFTFTFFSPTFQSGKEVSEQLLGA